MYINIECKYIILYIFTCIFFPVHFLCINYMYIFYVYFFLYIFDVYLLRIYATIACKYWLHKSLFWRLRSCMVCAGVLASPSSEATRWKNFPNLIKSNRNQIVFTMDRLTWYGHLFGWYVYLWSFENFAFFFSRFSIITFDWKGNFWFWWFHRKDLVQIYHNKSYVK